MNRAIDASDAIAAHHLQICANSRYLVPGGLIRRKKERICAVKPGERTGTIQPVCQALRQTNIKREALAAMVNQTLEKLEKGGELLDRTSYSPSHVARVRDGFDTNSDILRAFRVIWEEEKKKTLSGKTVGLASLDEKIRASSDYDGKYISFRLGHARDQIVKSRVTIEWSDLEQELVFSEQYESIHNGEPSIVYRDRCSCAQGTLVPSQ